MHREREKLQRAKEVLERRKSERDRLNADMHSVGDSRAKHPDYLREMRRANTEEMSGRPPWTASIRSDNESLIKLREKEIDVATLRIENHEQLPNENLISEARDTNHTNESDEPYLLNEEPDFYQDELETEFDDEHFDTNHKRNGYCVRNDLEGLKGRDNELYAFAIETEKYQTDIGRDLLLIEPTVFREYSFHGLKTGARSLPPRPPSNPKVVTPPLKSCLKATKENQKFESPLSETPRSFSWASSELMSSGTSQLTAVATSNMETAILPVSNAHQRTPMAMTHSTVKTMTNYFLNPWEDHQDKEYDDDLLDIPFDLDCKEHPYPQPAEEIGMPGLPCSGIDTPFQEPQRDNLNNPNASYPLDSVELTTLTHSTLPPRYTSNIESWQEDREFESSIPDEYHTPLLLPPRKYEDKDRESEEECFITSLMDSEASTTRLIAEVIAVQSRLEDCKLKPLDFKDIFAETPCQGKGRSRLEHCSRAEITPQDSSGIRSPSCNGYDLVHSQTGQGVEEVNMRDRDFFRPINNTNDGIMEEECRAEESGENPSNALGASSIDDHEKDVLTTEHCGSDRIDNFTELPTFEEIELRKKLHGAKWQTSRSSWEIQWNNEAEQQRRAVESIADLGCSDAKNELPANSTAGLSPFPCTITTPFKTAGSTLPVDFHSEKINQLRDLHGQHLNVRHVTIQTGDDLEESGENPHRHVGTASISTNPRVQHCDREEHTTDLRECSSRSTERTSKYLNIGYRNLSEAPRTKQHKHCFYSSQGLLKVGYSQSRQSPNTVKQDMLQINNRHGQAFEFQDSLGDKENYGMAGPDYQELSILASLERLDWKLAAISARAMNRSNTTPSPISQDLSSVQSAPAATGIKGVSTGTPGKCPVKPLRPSSANTQKAPTRNFRQRRIIGVTNKFRPD